MTRPRQSWRRRWVSQLNPPVSGGKKIDVIKKVRAITQLGLTEAKALVEGAPKAVEEGLNKDEAEKIKKQLEDAGVTVELKQTSSLGERGSPATGRPFCPLGAAGYGLLPNHQPIIFSEAR